MKKLCTYKHSAENNLGREGPMDVNWRTILYGISIVGVVVGMFTLSLFHNIILGGFVILALSWADNVSRK